VQCWKDNIPFFTDVWVDHEVGPEWQLKRKASSLLEDLREMSVGSMEDGRLMEYTENGVSCMRVIAREMQEIDERLARLEEKCQSLQNKQ
jgi:hypothetical protein